MGLVFVMTELVKKLHSKRVENMRTTLETSEEEQSFLIGFFSMDFPPVVTPRSTQFHPTKATGVLNMNVWTHPSDAGYG